MRKTLLVRLLTLAACGMVAGCATIASGTTQSISVSTNIEDADVFLDGVLIGQTPFTGIVKKNQSQLRIEADGYRTETLELSKSLDPVFWGNIIIGGTIGSITDFATGAAYQYAPAAYQVDLQRSDQSDDEFQAEVELRKFSMVYIDEISRDVSAGGGEYLDALMDILTLDSGAETEDVREALRDSRGDPVIFGRRIVALR